MNNVFKMEVISIVLIWQALLFAALFAGIFWKTRHYPKLLMSLYMFANALYFYMVWANYFSHLELIRWIYPLSMPLLLSFLPIFYYHLRSLTTLKYRVGKSQLMHLLPATVIFLLLLPYYLLSDASAYGFLSNHNVETGYEVLHTYLLWVNRIAFYGIFTMQFLFYVLKFRTNLKLYRLRLELMFSYKENLDMRWMRKLFIGILLFFIGNDLTYFLRDAHPWFSVSFYSIGMLLINFYIGSHSIIQNETVENEIIARMSHYCALHREMTQPRTESQELFIAQELQKYQRSALKTDTREMIIQQLDKLMAEEELYKDPTINIEELAMKLSVNSKHLSQAINEVHQRNFFNYINELRINKAKSMLEGSDHDHLSIEGIAKVVGFQSKSSFYTAFKKSTGTTPTEFRTQLNEAISSTEQGAALS